MPHVNGDDAQEKINVAGEAMKFEHFRHFAYVVDERFEGFRSVIAGRYGDLHGDAEANFVPLQKRDAFSDDAIRLKPLNPLPARRGGEPDRTAYFRNGRRRVLLQNFEDLSIDCVHRQAPP